MIHNHRILYLLIIMLSVPFLVGCTTAPPPPPLDTSAADSRAIEAASAQWVDAFNQGDTAALAALYTEEAKLLPPNSQMIVGREGIQAFFQASFDAGEAKVQLTVIELSVSGDIAHVVGKYTFTLQPEDGEAISDNGKYVEIWKRENGTWIMDKDIWNSSVPRPTAEKEEEEEL